MQILILIPTMVVVSYLLSCFIFLCLFQLETEGSDAAIIASIYGPFNSSNRELSNAGLRFKFGAVEVVLCCR